jgi:hypothetical protein
MEVDFWGVKSSGCENLHATEVICSNIPQKSWISDWKRSEMNVKETTFDQNSFTIQMSLGVIQSNGNESRKILIFAALTFISRIFRYEILFAKYVNLLDKLKEVKKSPFFFECALVKRVPTFFPYNALCSTWTINC